MNSSLDHPCLTVLPWKAVLVVEMAFDSPLWAAEWSVPRSPKRFSNAAVALIILAPLAFTGIFLGQ